MAKSKDSSRFNFDFEGLGFKPSTPYDLVPVEDFEVYIEPRVLMNMERQGGVESSAARLIYSNLSESIDQPGKLSLKFKHSYGLTIGQRKAVERIFNTQVEFQAQLLELFSKISTETGETMEAIGKRGQLLEKESQKNPDAFLADPIFAPYASDLLRLQIDQSNAIPYEACVATVRLQKLMSGWKLDHTLSLHESIYDQILEFDRVDAIDLLAGDDLGEASEALTSEPNSTSSEPIDRQTGMELDTISSSGESEI